MIDITPTFEVTFRINYVAASKVLDFSEKKADQIRETITSSTLSQKRSTSWLNRFSGLVLHLGRLTFLVLHAL